MDTPKKNKNQIEKEFRHKIFEQFLLAHELVVTKSIYGSMQITCKSASVPTTYAYNLQAIDTLELQSIEVDVALYDDFIPVKERIKVKKQQHENTKRRQLKEVFLCLVLDAMRNNLNRESFMGFLDKKIRKDPYDKIEDLATIITYLEKSDPEMLFEYIHRSKFLISHYRDALPMVLNSFNNEQQFQVFDKLMSLEIFKDVNNQNMIYKLVHAHLPNPEIYDTRFNHMAPDLMQDFAALASPTIKIDIDLKAVNSYNLKNRDYTAPKEIIQLLSFKQEQLARYGNELGFDDFSLDAKQGKLAFYFSGASPNERAITQCLNRLIKQSMTHDKLSNARSQDLSEQEVSLIVLNSKLNQGLPDKESQTPNNRGKI